MVRLPQVELRPSWSSVIGPPLESAGTCTDTRSSRRSIMRAGLPAMRTTGELPKASLSTSRRPPRGCSGSASVHARFGPSLGACSGGVILVTATTGGASASGFCSAGAGLLSAAAVGGDAAFSFLACLALGLLGLAASPSALASAGFGLAAGSL